LRELEREIVELPDDWAVTWLVLDGEAGTERWGLVDSPVGDYYCPVCRQAEAILNGSAASNGARVAYLHLPLSVHPHAPKAARISLCAAKAGSAAEAHALLMGIPRDEEPDVTRTEEVLGMAPGALEACQRSEEIQEALNRHTELAQRIGVPGTPTFIGPEDWRVGVVSWSELIEIAAP
jgi:protein-disulfide isomerase